jgi:hypothetical protein
MSSWAVVGDSRLDSIKTSILVADASGGVRKKRGTHHEFDPLGSAIYAGTEEILALSGLGCAVRRRIGMGPQLYPSLAGS